jgi:Phage integrase family
LVGITRLSDASEREGGLRRGRLALRRLDRLRLAEQDPANEGGAGLAGQTRLVSPDPVADRGCRRIQVRRRLYRKRFDAPKSRYGRRAVPLTEGMARALWRLRSTSPDEAPVFPSKAGGHLDPENVRNRVLKPAGGHAGLPWIGFHTFRHTCATVLFRNGLNAKQVQMWLGHHSPAFTLATYVHLLPDDLPDPAFLDQLTANAGVAQPAATLGTEPTMRLLQA